jgi:hypothetical protein
MWRGVHAFAGLWDATISKHGPLRDLGQRGTVISAVELHDALPSLYDSKSFDFKSHLHKFASRPLTKDHHPVPQPQGNQKEKYMITPYLTPLLIVLFSSALFPLLVYYTEKPPSYILEILINASGKDNRIESCRNIL